MDAESAKAYPVAVAWESLGVAETPAEYVFHRPRLYLETTIPSFLTARPSRALETARLCKRHPELLRFACTKAICRRFYAPLSNY